MIIWIGSMRDRIMIVIKELDNMDVFWKLYDENNMEM